MRALEAENSRLAFEVWQSAKGAPFELRTAIAGTALQQELPCHAEDEAGASFSPSTTGKLGRLTSRTLTKRDDRLVQELDWAALPRAHRRQGRIKSRDIVCDRFDVPAAFPRQACRFRHQARDNRARAAQTCGLGLKCRHAVRAYPSLSRPQRNTASHSSSARNRHSRRSCR